MKIKKIIIRNFGQFHNREFSFSPGLNVVYGENESGKSTLHTFLVSMLFGLEKAKGQESGKDSYSQYEPWGSTGFYTGEMDFEAGGRVCHLERNFYYREKQTKIIDIQSGEIISEENGGLQMLLGGLTKEMYENTCCIAQKETVPGKEWTNFVRNFMTGEKDAGNDNVQFQHAVQYLKDRREYVEKEMRRELEERGSQLERLQIERKILEEDVERLQHRKISGEEFSDRNVDTTGRSGRLYKGILLIGCLLAAGCFLSTALWNFPVKTAAIEGLLICILTAFLAVTVDRIGKKQVQPAMGGQEELREKQTRLFNILEYQTELEMPTDREQELKQEIAAYEIADQTIRGLGGGVYEDFRERINESTSRILTELTQGKYQRVEMDEDLTFIVHTGNRVCGPQQLGMGTLEQIYFALRMGLGELLTQKEPMPLLLDETFSGYDEARTRQALQWLGRQKEQTILFTCQRREMEYLEELGISFEKIELEGS